MRKISAFLILSILLTSCLVKKFAITPNSKTIYSPDNEQLNTSEIGITLVSKETAKKYEAIEITKEVKIRPRISVKTLKIGEIFIKKFETEKFDLYENINDPTYGIAISKNKEDPKVYSTGPTGIGLKFVVSKYPLKYKLTESPMKSDDYYKQEFIYNGKIGNGIKFIYREFVNDYARPAFTQNLQYDLSEDTIIGFRGLRLQVIKATNTKIEYKILNYFEK
jgi:regulatory protein YycI of two-component signal transduction system YycFG